MHHSEMKQKSSDFRVTERGSCAAGESNASHNGQGLGTHFLREESALAGDAGACQLPPLPPAQFLSSLTPLSPWAHARAQYLLACAPLSIDLCLFTLMYTVRSLPGKH